MSRATILADRVRAVAAHDPGRTAVVALARSLTYAELDTEAADLASRLARARIGRGSVVAIDVPRGANAVVALLGIMKCGAAYTVVERGAQTGTQLSRVIADADAMVTAGAAEADRPDCLTVEVRAASRRARSAFERAEPAYVLYTSGSTGSPKGVVVSNANVEHYVRSLLTRLEIMEPLAYAHVSSLSADLGNTSLFLALWTGGTLHVVDDVTRRDPVGLLSYLHRARIDVLKITPSHWSAVMCSLDAAGSDRPDLRYLVLGGELLTLEVARDTLRAGVARMVVNHYGPTETTIGVAAQVFSDVDGFERRGFRSVPVGTALGATKLLARAADGRFHAADATGELYIGGPSVGLGYLGDPVRTRDAFVTGVVGGQGRFYRSGDRVRIDSSGVVEFDGRVDRQVKVNGFRVELEHVEAVVRGADGVVDAAVCDLGAPGRAALGAAVVLEDGASPATVRTRLNDLLPSHMMPKSLLVLPELPRNANGKRALSALRSAFEQHSGGGTSGEQPVPEDPAQAEVQVVWQRYLGHHDFGPRTSFFDAGGSSLDAIQVIAELQVRGHPVSTNSFLADPTVDGLARQLSQPPAAERGEYDRRPTLKSRRFSSAQRWFFDQRFPAADHWNQAILLQAEPVLVPEQLRAAVADLVELHPLLRTSYRFVDGRWRADTIDAPDDRFSESQLTATDEAAVARHVRATAQRLHAEVDIARGRVFRAHLFRLSEQADQLLLVAHHLSVDAVSWRIIIDDLARLYGAVARGIDAGFLHEPVSFWDWVAHAEQYGNRLQRQVDTWRRLLPSEPGAIEGAPKRERREGEAQTAWVAFSREETAALTRELPASIGISPHAALLGAFVHALAKEMRVDQMLVDVESHGRTPLGGDIDVSRVVGWFTATFPILATAAREDAATTVRLVAETLDAVPEPCIGEVCRAEFPDLPTATLAYNYLGRFDFPRHEHLTLTPSRYAIGPARADANDRGHPLKLTARIIEDQLIVDLSFLPNEHRSASIVQSCSESKRLLLGLAGRDIEHERRVVERGSSAGLLTYVPASLPLGSGSGVKAYEHILLTGATGYIGIYVLRLLLERTSAHIHCLVRDRDGARAGDRLAATYRWYFPQDTLDRYDGRLTVVSARLDASDFGLSPDAYEQLCCRTDAIYHLAADTRLFGDAADFQRRNVFSVQTAIHMASHRKPKDLHLVSTLAVCGTNSSAVTVTFSEDSLDVGQDFQNEYERSKFAAECLVREFNAEGGRGFVYRAGNVSGESRTGRFRRDAVSSRLVQLLRAVVAVGRVPADLDDALVLSPVDQVAEAIVVLSLCPASRPGTFHVDSAHSFAMSDVIDALREFGHTLLPSKADDFTALFEPHVAKGDSDVSVGYFWTQRRLRNVRLDHRATHQLLAQLGFEFRALDRAWLRGHVRHLATTGALGQPSMQAPAVMNERTAGVSGGFANG